MNNVTSKTAVTQPKAKVDIRILLQRIVDRRNRRLKGTQGSGTRTTSDNFATSMKITPWGD